MITLLRDIWSGAWLKRQADPKHTPAPEPVAKESHWFGVFLRLHSINSDLGQEAHSLLRDALHEHLQKPEVGANFQQLLNDVIHKTALAHPELFTGHAQFQPVFTTISGYHDPMALVTGLKIPDKK